MRKEEIKKDDVVQENLFTMYYKFDSEQMQLRRENRGKFSFGMNDVYDEI